MKKNSVWYVGMDVHAKTIAVAVAEPEGTVRSLGSIANEPQAVRKLMEKLGKEGQEFVLRSRTDRLRNLLATNPDGRGV